MTARGKRRVLLTGRPGVEHPAHPHHGGAGEGSASHLEQQGWYQCDIAEALDVSEESCQPLAGTRPARRP